jgi:hypothetical protein
VKAGSQPVWDRLELRLIRMWTIGLASFDSLFNVDWGERVLERQSDRWRARLVQLQEEVDRLDNSRLAAIEDREAEPGHHIYYLEPDWAAIRARLARAMETAEPQAAEMYRESLAFIDETFLDSGRGSSPLRSPLASE